MRPIGKRALSSTDLGRFRSRACLVTAGTARHMVVRAANVCWRACSRRSSPGTAGAFLSWAAAHAASRGGPDRLSGEDVGVAVWAASEVSSSAANRPSPTACAAPDACMHKPNGSALSNAQLHGPAVEPALACKPDSRGPSLPRYRSRWCGWRPRGPFSCTAAPHWRATCCPTCTTPFNSSPAARPAKSRRGGRTARPATWSSGMGWLARRQQGGTQRGTGEREGLTACLTRSCYAWELLLCWGTAASHQSWQWAWAVHPAG
jgi:hypothetical protein